MHRASLNDLSPQERAELSQLIQQYATPTIVGQHVNAPPEIHMDGSIFLSFHRNYLAGLESYLVGQGHPEWSPLPAWDPATRIPDEFNPPNQGPNRLVDLNPNVSFSPEFDPENLGNFETDEDLGMDQPGARHHRWDHGRTSVRRGRRSSGPGTALSTTSGGRGRGRPSSRPIAWG